MKLRKHRPKRRVVPAHLASRVQSLSGESLFTNFDNVLMTMSALVDEYHFHDAPGTEVSKCLDALYTLWTEILARDI